MRVLGGAAVLVAALICMVALGSSRKAVAASSLCNVYVELKAESSDYVTGEVGQAINPYFFTLTIVKNPSTDVNYEVAGIDPKFQKDYAAGADVTDWFRGQIDEVAGKYRILPKGLAVTLVDAIHAGDTTARLKISGTPLMGANWYMPFSSYESAFCSESFLNGLSARDKKQLQKPAEISYGLRFDIGRKSSSWQTGGVSVSSLKISGSAGSAVTQKELTYTIKNGNFLVDLPQGKDVSDWFRSTMYLYNWNTQEYVYCRLPAGMKVTLKKAVKAGDRSCTFVFSGTPTCGSKDCIAIIIPGDGTVSTSSEGTMRAECGYSETGWYSSNFDFMYNISGDIVRPEITVDDASISGTVGHAIADDGSNIITFHLSNCTLERTIEAGSRDLSGCLIDVRSNGEYSALDQYGLYAEVVRFVYGEDYFKIKITGTPQKNGSLNIIIRLFEEDTDAGCRIKSKTNGNARFAFSSPDTGAHAYISSKEVTTMQGFAVDTEEMCFVAGFLTGEDAGSEVKYVVNGTFAKDQDVSKYFDGLPGGLKAYAAKNMTDPAEMEVYLKGVPTSAYRYEVKFKVAPYEWAKKTKAAGSNTWTTELQSNSHDSYATFVINTVDNKVNHVFAYPYSLDPHDENTGAISGLPYDKMVEAVDKVPIRVGGNLSVHKQVVVENGVARLENKTTYTNHGANIWLYIPRLYLSKAYAAGSSVNDIVRLKAVDSAGNLVDAPITGYNIVTETALEKGTKIGVNVLLYIEGIGATATESFEGLAIQVYTHSAFMNAVMPANSAFEIAQVVTGSDPADVSKCNGLRATIGNCSINGIFGMTLEDTEGLSVTVTGDTFKKWNRGQDVSDWFTNMPAGLYAIVRDSVEAGETSTIGIQFAKRNKQNKVTKVTPTGSVSCRDAIEISVPFSALVGGCSGGAYAGVDGIVVAAVNGKAKFNILSAADLNSSGKPMIVSHNFTGVYKAGQPIGEGFEETIVYLPNVGQLDEEGNRPFVELIAKEGDFVDQYLDGRTFPVGHSEAKKQSNGIWTMSVSANKNDIYAARYCEDSLSAVVNLMGRQYEVTDTYLTYTISDHAAEELSEDVVPGDD
ncbi:MAG: hypothetical protein ILP10_07500, partial [Lachnospiraceae bacterium]|nr:hypothetical protein [Lachnospiraceae bacterium]